MSSAIDATTAPSQVGFWAGQSGNTSIYTPALWSLLDSENSFVFFNLEYGSDFGPAISGSSPRIKRMKVVREANAAGVPISAWITFPATYGTFSNEQNASLTQKAVKAFYYWKEKHHLRFHQAVLDLEFPLGTQVVTDAANGNLSTAKALLSGKINPAAQCKAIAIYRATIAWAHQQGLRIAGSPIPFALDDLANGDIAMQDALDMVVFPPSGYDELYLQAYRAFGIDLGSGYVARYFREMQSRFGARGQVTIGNTGLPPYSSVTAVVQDVRMLAALGARTIPIFDLDNAVSTYGLSGIRKILDAAQHPMNAKELAAATKTPLTGGTARRLFGVLDTLATTLTPIVSGQPPNKYPDGCGALQAPPVSK